MERIVLFVVLMSMAESSEHDWGYFGDNVHMPHDWSLLFANCAGQRQSPIAIDSNSSSLTWLGPLSLTGYSLHGNFRLLNNKHTLVFFPPEGSASSVSGASLPGRFRLLQAHLHWGRADDDGSEHVIDGNKYPVEIHLVHQNEKYENDQEAARWPDGLAVIGVLAKVGEENKLLASLLNSESIEAVLNAGSQFITAPLSLNLADFLPQNASFFRYAGSLTTPPCLQIVTWTVMANPVSVSGRQLAMLRRLTTRACDSSDGHSSCGHSSGGHSNDGHSSCDDSSGDDSSDGHSSDGHSSGGHSSGGDSSGGDSSGGDSSGGHSSSGDSSSGDSSGVYISGNFRPVQPINGRRVIYSV